MNRRKKRADENRRYNKLAAGSSAPIQSCFKISDKPNKRVGII
jgi:hypothetical protein